MQQETVRSHPISARIQLATTRSQDLVGGRADMRKGEQTRREIIRKAAPIFNQRGYDGAALSDLMRATGLEKGGIYRHFDSKQQLVAEAFDYAWKLAIDARFEGTRDIANTVDRLKTVRPELSGPARWTCTRRMPQLRRKARRALDYSLDRLQSIAKEGKRKGEVHSAIDPGDFAALIVSTLEGGLMMSRLQRRDDP